MATITEVTLRNFRGFAKLEKLRLARLTFLVGPNSAGKSSVADALLFMAQSGFLSLDATSPRWIGQLVDLGSFKDTVYGHEPRRTIEIGVGLGLAEGDAVVVEVQIKTFHGAPDGGLKRLAVRLQGSEETVALVRRVGRKESFQLVADDRSEDYEPAPWTNPYKSVMAAARRGRAARLRHLLGGEELEEIATQLHRVSSGRHPPQRTYVRDGGASDEQARRLLDGIDTVALDAGQVRRRIVEGLLSLGIADDLQIERLREHLAELRLQDNVTGVVSNLTEFGYGASQVLPVLEGCAMPGAGPLFIEQPEIHLHPRAQGQLAQIICESSKRRQMIVETHSEHMINRARRLVAEGKMKASDVVIHYIDRDEKGSHATTIGLDDAGDFNCDWPDGFYDERYHETMKIAEAQAKRGRSRRRKAGG